MWTLSAFGDELAPDVEAQLDILHEHRIRQVDLRDVQRAKVHRLGEEDWRAVKAALQRRGVRVASIGSPIGKVPITDPFPPHLEEFRRVLRAARFFGAAYVRIFSFYMPPGDDPARYRDAVLERLQRLVAAAEGEGISLLHENERAIYGDVPARCHDLHAHVPGLFCCWDPANFVHCGVQPHDEAYALLRPYIRYVHVKDAERATLRATVAGAGDAQWRETLAALRDSGWSGTVSLEPHLAAAGAQGGFTGPGRFRQAVDAVRQLLREAGIRAA